MDRSEIFQTDHIKSLLIAIVISSATAYGHAQTTTTPAQTTQPAAATQPAPPPGSSASGDVGRGAGDIGKGTGEGVGKAAEGTGKGVADVVTLHPINGAESIGKGVGVGAKDVGVGAVEGTGKVTEGIGKGIAKPFHHKSKDKTQAATTPPPDSEL